jgi:hypothetical protein
VADELEIAHGWPAASYATKQAERGSRRGKVRRPPLLDGGCCGTKGKGRNQGRPSGRGGRVGSLGSVGHERPSRAHGDDRVTHHHRCRAPAALTSIFAAFDNEPLSRKPVLETPARRFQKGRLNLLGTRADRSEPRGTKCCCACSPQRTVRVPGIPACRFLLDLGPIQTGPSAPFRTAGPPLDAVKLITGSASPIFEKRQPCA